MKRQINYQKYDIEALYDQAISTASVSQRDLENAAQTLRYYGNTDPAAIERYARERAILSELSKITGANFVGQVGKIDFSTREKAIAGINAYLSRRTAGMRQGWGKR